MERPSSVHKDNHKAPAVCRPPTESTSSAQKEGRHLPTARWPLQFLRPVKGKDFSWRPRPNISALNNIIQEHLGIAAAAQTTSPLPGLRLGGLWRYWMRKKCHQHHGGRCVHHQPHPTAKNNGVSSNLHLTYINPCNQGINCHRHLKFCIAVALRMIYLGMYSNPGSDI